MTTMTTFNRACPVCGKPARFEARPFCSPRCRDVDLARWFGEEYRIPAAEQQDDGDLDETDLPTDTDDRP